VLGYEWFIFGIRNSRIVIHFITYRFYIFIFAVMSCLFLVFEIQK